MEVKLFKKTFSAIILSTFALLLFFNFSETKTVYSQEVYYDEKSEIYPCSESSNGECVLKTRKYKNTFGYETTQAIRKPNDGISGGEFTEDYTDRDGQKWYRSGTVNSNDDITSSENWKRGEKIKIEPQKDEKFTYTLLEPLPFVGGELSENVTLEQYLGWAYRFVLSIAAFLAVLQITIGGVMWIASGANEKTRGEAKAKIESAIWGLVLAFAAYLVLYTINPQLVSFESNSFFNTNKETQK